MVQISKKFRFNEIFLWGNGIVSLIGKRGVDTLAALNSKKINYWISFIIVFFIMGGSACYIFLYTPKNSIELYQAISFADDFEEAQELMGQVTVTTRILSKVIRGLGFDHVSGLL